MIDFAFLQVADSLLGRIPSFLGGERILEPQGNFILTTGALVLAAIFGYMLWKKSIRSTQARDSGSTVLPQEISSILEQAMFHRSRVDVGFHPISASRQTNSCALYELAGTGITLELPAGVSPAENWIGKVMVCYFRLPRGEKSPYFYKFISNVVGLHAIGDVAYLTLSLPDKVELGQKRRHLRLEVPPTDVRDFRIWASTENTTFHLESDLSKWPKPLAIMTGTSGEGLKVVDISGSGIKFAFHPTHCPGLGEYVVKNPLLFMRLDLEALGKMSFPAYYIASRLRTKNQDFDTGLLMLGYEFMEFCSDQGAETLQWTKVEEDSGIDDIVTWVFRRHLELYREQENV